MGQKLSQPTLGLVREFLEQMEPDNLRSTFAITKFWRDELFDAGFDPTFIDIATSYHFGWSKIIPDLLVGRFGGQNSYASNALPQHECEEALVALSAFALKAYWNSALGVILRQALISDGINLTASEVASPVLAELAQIPGEKELVSYIQQKLDKKELVSVLYIDLDGFKSVNDKLGHAEGDKCLIRVASRMTEAILGKGKLYRPYGDDFVVVFSNFTKGEATSTAERIRSAVADDNPGGTLEVTVSIGVVSSQSGQTGAEALIHAAAKAMYVAKEARNCVAVA